MVDLDIVGDVKQGFRVCPVGFGSCDIGVDECNPLVEAYGDGFFMSSKCPHLKAKKNRRRKKRRVKTN
jgi:hypothetical protein